MDYGDGRINAREELEPDIQARYMDILCASLEYEDNPIVLKVGWDSDDMERFLDKLDFWYYGEGIYGYIFLRDGSWMERVFSGEREYWDIKDTPQIPKECL